MRKTAEQREAFEKRLRPLLGYLFHAACAVTGNAASAELALEKGVLAAYADDGERGRRLSFRENALRCVLAEAEGALEAQSEAETGFRPLPETDESAPIRLLASKDVALQRAAILRYGCGQKTARCAKLVGWQADALRDEFAELTGGLAKLAREADEARPPEKWLGAELKRYMARPGAAALDASYVLGVFEREAAVAAPRRHLVRKGIRAVLATLAAALGMGIFWLFAILLER